MSPAVAAPQSVGRIFSVLSTLAVAPEGDTLSALARRVGAPKSSLISLLAGMCAEGILDCDADGRYRLGPRMLSLSMQVLGRRELPDLARPVMQRLVANTGETVLLGALATDDDVATYFAKIESPNPVRYTVPLGERRELYCSALGKLILAHLPAARRNAYLARPLQAFTSRTVTSVRRLRAELAQIAESGLSHTDGERVEGVSALAAAVHGPDGTFAAGLIVAGPSERMRRERARHESLLRAAAGEIASLLAAGPAPRVVAPADPRPPSRRTR